MHSHDALSLLEAAEQAGNISAAASANIRPWLTEAKYAEFAPEVADGRCQGRASDVWVPQQIYRRYTDRI